MVLVVVHLAAAIFMSFLHHENLLKSMVNGKKQGTIDQAIKSPLSPVGLLLAVAWALAFSLLVSGAMPAFTQ